MVFFSENVSVIKRSPWPNYLKRVAWLIQGRGALVVTGDWAGALLFSQNNLGLRARSLPLPLSPSLFSRGFRD